MQGLRSCVGAKEAQAQAPPTACRRWLPVQFWEAGQAASSWLEPSCRHAVLQAAGWIGLVVAGIAFYTGGAEMINERFNKVGRVQACTLCYKGDMQAHLQPNPRPEPPHPRPASAAAACWVQTLLPLGVVNWAPLLVPGFQRGIGAIPLVGSCYLRPVPPTLASQHPALQLGMCACSRQL